MHRIQSLLLAFCGLGLFFIIMRPRTERFLERIVPLWVKALLTSLFEALFISVMLFGILGVFSKSGVHLIQHYPISFIVISAIGTALFLWANVEAVNSGSWPPKQ
jgi:hypothetical protein